MIEITQEEINLREEIKNLEYKEYKEIQQIRDKYSKEKEKVQTIIDSIFKLNSESIIGKCFIKFKQQDNSFYHLFKVIAYEDGNLYCDSAHYTNHQEDSYRRVSLFFTEECKNAIDLCNAINEGKRGFPDANGCYYKEIDESIFYNITETGNQTADQLVNLCDNAVKK